MRFGSEVVVSLIVAPRSLENSMSLVCLRSFIGLFCFLFLFHGAANVAAGQTLEQRLMAEPAAELAKAARAEGDVVRGALVFHHSSVTCVACHSVGDRLNSIGPDLSKLDPKTSDVSLVESLLEPSKVIAPAYATIAVETVEGLVVRGVIVQETAETLTLSDASQPQKFVELKIKDIESRQPTTVSIMPVGQMNLLTDRRQFLDLLRYLMALRDGGPDQAREIARSLESLVREFPDQPLPNRPVVQRGEVAVGGFGKFPRGIAIGFDGGTVLFDADRLAIVATWQDGFVKSSPGNYFGVFLQQVGNTPKLFPMDSHPLKIKLPGSEAWQDFEMPMQSDPNTGTRFDGYQVGRDWVRLHYRVLVEGARIQVAEDIRVERRPDWHRLVRRFQFSGAPLGTQFAIQLVDGAQVPQLDVRVQTATTPDSRLVPLFVSQSDHRPTVIFAQAEQGAKWSLNETPGRKIWQLESAPIRKSGATGIGIDSWNPLGTNPTIDPAALQNLQAASPVVTDLFDATVRDALPVPEPTELDEPKKSAVPERPGVNPKENIDEFPAIEGRFLRFVVTGTNDQSAPGIDELEIYGSDPQTNLALKGKATASSTITGYSIHQTQHLNDGKLGNPNSWISAENNGGWAQIELPEPMALQKVIWARDRTGTCTDRLAVRYRIEVSSDGQKWIKVGDESGRALPVSMAVGPINRNAASGYEMESIPLPFSGCRPSDIIFAPDGTMYLIAMTEGQIWRARTPSLDRPQRVRWQRYASGLYHPIGLAIVGDRLFVAQKPEITELIDRDGDGIADHYRTLATGWGLSTGWHEYCFGLAVDRQKNLWFALNTGYFWTNPGYVNPGRWRGSVMRVSTETQHLDEIAKGCRVPNGVSRGPADDLFFTDNQGDWIQACKLAHIVPGRFYGHPEYQADALPSSQYPDGRSAVWFPYHRMRSISGPIHDDTQGKFGPFADQIFVGDVGYGANPGIMRVALEKIDGEYQGACFPFVDHQPLGCERMRFGPDNCLYVTSLTSGLTRLKYVGVKKPAQKQTVPFAMQSIHIRPGGRGFVLRLTKPLGAGQAVQPALISVKRYHYLYTGNYGSPPSNEMIIPVETVELSADRSAITLTLPVETHPLGMVYEFRVNQLLDEAGESMQHREAWYTVHKIPVE